MHAQLIALIAYGAGSEKTVCMRVWDEYLFYVVCVRVCWCVDVGVGVLFVHLWP